MLILEPEQLTSNIPDQSAQNATTSDQQLAESESRMMESDEVLMQSSPTVFEPDQCAIETDPTMTKLDQVLVESFQSEMQPRVSVMESVQSMMEPVSSATESVSNVMGSTLNTNWIPAMATPVNTYLMTIHEQGVQRTMRLRSCYDGRYMYTYKSLRRI